MGNSETKDQMTKQWIAVLEAADAAARWHVHQRRKGAAEEPYINHLLEVATLVATATDGKDPELVIAALLHDAIEDQEVPSDLIAEKFGEDVANLVKEATDDKSLPTERRKQLQIDEAPKKSRRAKILKLADKTSNLKAIAASPPSSWSVKRRLEYVVWARDVGRGLKDVSPWLESLSAPRRTRNNQQRFDAEGTSEINVSLQSSRRGNSATLALRPALRDNDRVDLHAPYLARLIKPEGNIAGGRARSPGNIVRCGLCRSLKGSILLVRDRAGI